MAARPLTIGTAGHVDHGKTALVAALTGCDTDRLAEEKRRGMSIELGFAELDLGSRRLSLIDTPGHERFVRTMIAGASGIDLYLLVVAADEGVMPQTREHMAVLHALGVDLGLVALNRCDLAEAGIRELAAEDCARLVPGAEPIEVSARTGAGIEALRGAWPSSPRWSPRLRAAGRVRRRCCTSTGRSPWRATAPSSPARSGRGSCVGTRSCC